MTTATPAPPLAKAEEKSKKTVQGKAFDRKLFARVFAFTGPYRGIFRWTVFLTIVLSIVGVVRPIMLGWLIDVAATDYTALFHLDANSNWNARSIAWIANVVQNLVGVGTMTLVWSITISVAVLLLVETVVQYFQSYWTSWLGQAVTFDLRQKLYSKILGFKLRYFDKTPIGTLVTRAISDIETIDDIFSQGLLSIMGDILKLVVVVVVMFVYNWKLALLSMVPIPLLLWSTNIFKNSIQKSFQDVRTQVSRLNAFVQEHIQGMAVVQLFGREKQEYNKFQAINREHRKAHVRSILAYSIFFPVVEILSAVSLAFLVWWGVKDVLEGVATLGDIFAYILFINMLYRPIRQLADRFNVLQMGMVGSERVFAVLDTDADLKDTGSRTTENLRGDIVFKNVWFAYGDLEPGEEPDWVLRDISFQAKAGEMIALVGATGSGKSTTINILSRAYEFQRGEVLLDGHDIRTYTLSDLRKSISVVLQDVFLFSDSIHNNITLGDPTISRDAVIAAAKTVGAHDFIMRLPDGYDMSVRERGSILSLGQRQLIAFIRAAVHQPRVLILDEATSSVDSMSEQLIQQATERITKDRTSIVIAHRLSTIQKADRIIVLGKGRILEQGNHQELLAYNGAYRKLYDLQFR
ncbi:MAG TPA: ABC transporter ATP-binding protein [Flavobacteriales bacterium]|nr:ABC transporter ATP-binding protein [Flavobacteriales bacterium]HQW40660.1 ABC transporter ATP-binding protein [Flavobacteriales bacterium]